MLPPTYTYASRHPLLFRFVFAPRPPLVRLLLLLHSFVHHLPPLHAQPFPVSPSLSRCGQTKTFSCLRLVIRQLELEPVDCWLPLRCSDQPPALPSPLLPPDRTSRSAAGVRPETDRGLLRLPSDRHSYPRSSRIRHHRLHRRYARRRVEVAAQHPPSGMRRVRTEKWTIGYGQGGTKKSFLRVCRCDVREKGRKQSA